MHEAFNWAWHKERENAVVVVFELNDDDFLENLKPLCLNLEETRNHRHRIKKNNQTRTYKFNVNVVWAPVVGKYIPGLNQFKYENKNAKKYLSVTKTIDLK